MPEANKLCFVPVVIRIHNSRLVIHGRVKLNHNEKIDVSVGLSMYDQITKALPINKACLVVKLLSFLCV